MILENYKKGFGIFLTYIGASFCRISDRVKVTYDESHQVCAHFNALLEFVDHQVCTLPRGGGRYKGHVEEGLEVLFPNNGHREFSLHGWLIKAREGLACWGSFKLSGGQVSRKFQCCSCQKLTSKPYNCRKKVMQQQIKSILYKAHIVLALVAY